MQETELFGISTVQQIHLKQMNPTPNFDDFQAFQNLTTINSRGYENFQRPPNVFIQSEFKSICKSSDASTLCNQSEIRTNSPPSQLTVAFYSTNYVLILMGICRAPRAQIRSRSARVSTLLYHIFLLFVTRATVTGWPPPKERVC